ncbi:MAG: chromosome segregation protein SMC [Syntrophomonadaceae bacterium]|nr:chromosome segregation protein SMC [Syntrophomonadaceae bacterium]
MYLKRIDIKGFKSFADNTEIILNPGINIVVGPNGCGKSNVVDAIRWVLGEANVRHLRGQKSDDVIFNGSDRKRALGMATVEMTLDNHDHLLPLDFSDVTLGRKIYRTGESEFYINKTLVRMKDVLDLFMGTGLGKKGYSIIGQGELEQVLNGQPLDRRLILEEAAGIIKYRQQRDEVKKRLNNTASDLLRLNDIMEELRQRKNEVFKKAEKARLFMKMSKECQEQEKKVLSYELNKIGKDIGQKKVALVTKLDEQKNLTGQFEKMEIRLSEEELALNSQQSIAIQLREEKHALDSAIGSHHGNIRLSEERIRNNQERISLARDDENKYSGLLGNIDRDLELSRVDCEAERGKYLEKIELWEKLQLEVRQMEEDLGDYYKNFETKKAEVFDKIKQETQVKNELSQNEELFKKSRERNERLSIHKEELADKIKNHRQNRIDLEEEKNILESYIEKSEAIIAGLAEQKKQKTEFWQKAEEQYKELIQKSIKIDNSLLSLKDMQKRLVGYSPAVKIIFNSAKQGSLQGVLGLMGEIIDVPQGMELAIDTAAGSGLQNIVVEKVGHAKTAIEFLKRQGQGRVTFLPLDILKVSSVPGPVLRDIAGIEGVLGLAANLVKYDKAFEKAVEYLLGRVLLVKDMEKGIKVFKNLNYPLRIVSLEGELINVSGAISGGTSNSAGNSPLQRRGEEKKLLKLQHENKLACDENRAVAEAISKEIQEIDKEYNSNRDIMREYQFRHDLLCKQISALDNDLVSWQEEKENYLRQLDKLNREGTELELIIANLQQEQSQMQRAGEIVSAELEKLKENIELGKRDFEVHKERLASFTDQLEMKKKELENIDKNIGQFQQVKNSYLESHRQAGELKARLQEENSNELLKIAHSKNEAEILQQELKRVMQESGIADSAQQLHRSNIENLRSEMIPARQELLQRENYIRSTEVNLARLEAEMEAINDKWQDKFGDQTEQEGSEIFSAAEIRDYRSRIAELQQELETLGSVDLEAIHEHEEINQRFEFMQQQFTDLSEARESLDALLKETEKIMLKNFANFMILAAKSFHKTFAEIFGGGEALLKLETDADRLEAGVNIEVKMPGKKTQPLNLLSGGERALTCIAFIFSLLRLRPAPFCLLDEIDASLDETNLFRFSNFVKSMSDDIQFIVITHRQATIEAGENIYGVTMPEEGISSVFSINMVEAESLAG